LRIGARFFPIALNLRAAPQDTSLLKLPMRRVHLSPEILPTKTKGRSRRSLSGPAQIIDISGAERCICAMQKRQLCNGIAASI
jgi:hypothetical protein